MWTIIKDVEPDGCLIQKTGLMIVANHVKKNRMLPDPELKGTQPKAVVPHTKALPSHPFKI